MEFMPHVVEAEHVKDYLIKVKFNDGTKKLVDFSPYINKGGIFAKLKDKGYFKRFFVDLNTVCWPNCVFRSNLSTHSDLNHPFIPNHSIHSFRFIPSTCSEGFHPF
jgi:hypothetical protein